MAERESGAAQAATRADVPEPPFLTLSDAADATGRSLAAIRSLVRRDLRRPQHERRLRLTKGNGGEWLIAVPPEWHRSATHVDLKREHGPAYNGALERRLADIERVIVDQIADLQRALAMHQHDLAAARLALAQTEGERDTAQALAAAQREASELLVQELRDQLARARRPFWWAWLGRG